METTGILTKQQVTQMATEIAHRVAINTKDVLTAAEAAAYLGISKSYLYKLTMGKQIPFYKPTGKLCYFERGELNKWLLQNRCSTDAELEDKAQAYTQRKGAKL